jgi:hypothetical protein
VGFAGAENRLARDSNPFLIQKINNTKELGQQISSCASDTFQHFPDRLKLYLSPHCASPRDFYPVALHSSGTSGERDPIVAILQPLTRLNPRPASSSVTRRNPPRDKDRRRPVPYARRR